MSKKHRRTPSQRPSALPVIESALDIVRYSNECRGIATHQGKTVFVRNALMGEKVLIRVESTHKRFDEGEAIDIIEASQDRVTPPCQYYNQCGGCDLQHLHPDSAPLIKQHLVLDWLKRSATTIPSHIDPPVLSTAVDYRRSARIGINQRQRDGELLTGFRRRQSSKIINIDHCPVLDTRLQDLFSVLHSYLEDRDEVRSITDVLVSLGDHNGAIRFRVVKNATPELKQIFISIARHLQLSAWIEEDNQPPTPLSNDSPLSYQADANTKLHFKPGDFLQVNAEVNRAMIQRAKEWLEPQPDQTLLDLFCGLGNFSLPLARNLKQVIGIEGSREMVQRAKDNADLNAIDNADFYSADLSQPIKDTAWYRQHKPELILLDPPRTGAAELIPQLLRLKPLKILYIACHPAALVRDSQTLTEAGFRLTRFCVLDMFPNTSHIESMALFEVKK